MPNCVVCLNPASSLCSLCKGSDGSGIYCSQQCQTTDWATHKNTCSGRPKTTKKQKAKGPPKPPPFVVSEADKEDAKILPLMYYHPGQSPFGCSIDPSDMIPVTLSSKMKSWVNYSESEPRDVYLEISDAFKYHIMYNVPKFRSSDANYVDIGKSLPMERAIPAFKIFFRRYSAGNKLPPWWTEGHTAELLRLTEEDERIGVDKPFDDIASTYEPRYTARNILVRISTIAEATCHVPVDRDQSDMGSVSFMAPAHFDDAAAAQWLAEPTYVHQA